MGLNSLDSLFELSEVTSYYVPKNLYEEYLNAFELQSPMEPCILDNFQKNNEGLLKNNFNSLNFCPICLIKKPHKTHHVKRLNLCVRDYHFYLYFFEKVIFGKNVFNFIIIAIFNTIFALGDLTIAVHFNLSSQLRYLQKEYLIYLCILMSYFYLLYYFASYIVLILVAAYYGLTYDELLKSFRYPYLIKSVDE